MSSPRQPTSETPETFEPFPLEFTRQYDIIRLLGSGAMGRVYEAKQYSLSRRVAVKVMRPDAFRDVAAAERFREEARILSRLSHPSIVRLFDAGLAGNVPYIVTEFVAGETLAKRLGMGGIPIEEAVRIVLALLEGLEYLHANGVVHRDLKPENAFLLPDGSIKLIDFGLARPVERSTALTEVGFAVGTPVFMAPEQILGEACSPAWDMYAAGVILFRALTGSYPFPTGSTAEIVERKLRGEPRPLGEAMPNAPGWLRAAVDGALTRDASVRFVRVEELRRALAPGVPVTASRSDQLPAARPRGRGARDGPAHAAHGPWLAGWVLAAALTVAGLAGAAAVAWRSAGENLSPGSLGSLALPAKLEVRPAPDGGHLVCWQSDEPSDSAVELDGRVWRAGGHGRTHAVRLPALAEGASVDFRVLSPAGTFSPALTVRVPRFKTARVQLERGVDAAILAIDAEVPCRVDTVVVDARGGEWRLPPAAERTVHRIAIAGLDAETDYALRIQLSAGDASCALGPLTSPAPLRAFAEFHDQLRALDLDEIRDDIFHVRDRREPPAQSAARIEARLATIDYRRKLRKLGPLARAVAATPRLPPRILSVLHDQMKELRKVDLFCGVLRIPFASGVEALETPAYRLSTTPTLEAGSSAGFRQLDVMPPGGQDFESRALEPWLLFGKLSRYRQSYILDLSGTKPFRRAEAGLLAAGFLPGAAFELTVNERNRPASMLFGHRAAGFPTDSRPRWLYHAFDARCLPLGPVEFQVKFSTPVAEPKRMSVRLERLVLRLAE